MRISDWSSDVCSSDLSLLASTAAENIRQLPRCLGMCLSITKCSTSSPESKKDGLLRRAASTSPRDLAIISASALGAIFGAGGLGVLHPGIRASQRSATRRSEEHTSELQSLMRISYAVFCLKKKTKI